MQKSLSIAIIGAGPAGLMAAEILATAGHRVTIFDRKPSAARKFLMAGRGGLNLTHSEPLEKILTRYGAASDFLKPHIENFSPQNLREWCEQLGQKTFVGTSGRVFPESMKASPLLRAWLARLDESGVTFNMQRTWKGWNAENQLVFEKQNRLLEHITCDAVLLALGGASWPNLGSDGSWTKILEQENIPLSPLRPSNCGFFTQWSQQFHDRHAGQPLKNIKLTFKDTSTRGEAMITKNGIEGGAIYALSSLLRKEIEEKGSAEFYIDFHPNLTLEDLTKKLNATRGRRSFSTHMQKTSGLSTAAIGLLRETDRDIQKRTPEDLAKLLKNLPVTINKPFSLDRAISSAGGIRLDALDENFMLKNKPGVFACGEMLDWEAPTGGYLLQAVFSTAHAASYGIIDWLNKST